MSSKGLCTRSQAFRHPHRGFVSRSKTNGSGRCTGPAIQRVVPRCSASSYKNSVAEKAVEGYVQDGFVVGLGSGELVNLAIQEIGRRLTERTLKDIVVVPVSDAAAHEAAFHGVPLYSSPSSPVTPPKLDVILEEADQIDLKHNAFIKGGREQPQQPQLTRLREAVERCSQVVVLVDQNNVVERLGGSLPVTMDAERWENTADEIDDLFLGDAELWRRPMSGTANPQGGKNPYVSPEGHTIVDVRFYEGIKLLGEDAPYDQVSQEVLAVEGVHTHGLMVGVANAAIIAQPDEAARVVTFS